MARLLVFGLLVNLYLFVGDLFFEWLGLRWLVVSCLLFA